jgi:filamentous hemagglutinin family protein
MQPSQPAQSSSVTFLSHRRRAHGRRSVRTWRIKPLVQAAALTLLAASAHAQTRAFSGAWFAERGAAQNTAAATGRLPNGTPVALINDPQQQSQQARQQLQQSLANLNGVAAAIAAQQAAQNAARQAALSGSSDVPDGLTDGGLKVDTNSLTRGWVNANAPVQSNKDGRVNVAIQQTADKAVLNWETYNVGRNTTVEYQQQSNWSVLNRVNDPNGRPSQIRGQIKADGTVLIVNRNGVIFTGSSQVDTRNLVAAAANVTDDQFRKGLYGDNATPTFTNAGGKIKVEAGAQINTRAPESVTQGGGYVLLVGTEVENAGTINTPKGQTQLAAGDNFIIRKGVGTDGNTMSTTRGNEIAPQFVADSTAGRVVNSGLIVANQGDITLAGRDVAQNGVAISTTTVNTRGTIHLLNSAADTQGRVTVGPGATTAILIEQDAATALDSQRNALLKDSAAQDKLRADTAPGAFDNLSRLSDRRDLSRIEIVSGGDVLFADNSLSLATGGQIQVNAARRALVTDRARLDVGGAVGVQVSMESNNVQVNVQGNEQRDAPGNRDSGVLNNANVWIDRRRLIYVPAKPGVYDKDRYYTAGGLLEVGGYLDNTGHSIGEWAAQGGTVTLGGKEVVTQRGSSINLSGGSLDVQSGYLRQTFLKGRDGQLYDASSAPMDVLYAGVYQGFEAAHPRWGSKTTEYYYSPLIAPRQKLENGYTAGRDAGQLILSTPTAVVDGDIVSAVYNGPRQTQARSPSATDGYMQAQTAVAIPAALRIGRYDGYGLAGAYDTQVRIDDVAAAGPISLTDALPADRINTIQLDAQRLNDMGLGGLSIASQGNVTIDKRLALADGGAVSVSASSIDVNADVVAHGGNVTLSNVLRAANPATQAAALTKDGKSRITLAQGATVDVSGLWVNGALDPATVAGMAWLNGGNVSLEGVQGIALATGSTIDVSSGASILANGSVRGGTGGNVTLTANTPPFAPATADGSTLQLGSTIKGYGVNGGGTLTVEADKVLVSDGSGVQSGQLLLTPDFFRQGFSAYDVNGYRGLTVAPGTTLNVEMPVYFVPDAARNVATGAHPADVLTLWTPPVYQEDAVNAKLIQRGGASLTLESNSSLNQTVGSQLQVGQGARIVVDPGQAVALQTPGQITIDGAITAPGGTINVLQMNGTDGANGRADYVDLARSIWIGDHAVLDVSARAVSAVDSYGRRYGQAGSGGTIAIGPRGPATAGGTAPAANAFIVIRPGALLEASGAHTTVDVTEGAGASLSAGQTARPVELAGDGGTISLASFTGLQVDGTLRAFAGGAGAAGGTLSVTLETPHYLPVDGVSFPSAVAVPRELEIGSTYRAVLPADARPGESNPALAFGKARISTDRIGAGGFDALSVYADMITFDGPVNLSLGRSLQVQSNALSARDGVSAVHLSAPYVRFGSILVGENSGIYPLVGGAIDPAQRLQIGPLPPLPTTAALTVDANMVDLGFLYTAGANGTVDQYQQAPLQIIRPGFDTLALNSTGDIRVNLGGGVSRQVTMNAAQVYPVSGAQGRLVATERLALGRTSEDTPDVPNSVFGTLRLFAPVVEQGGVLRAPLGNLVLGGTTFDGLTTTTNRVSLLPGSLTSVSAAGLTLPYGGTSDGVSYTVNGTSVAGAVSLDGASGVVRLAGKSFEVAPGAVVDLSGGGTIAGAGFVSGRGGSVDVLTTPLINANPTLAYSAAGNSVYAIVPGYHSAYAPFDINAGAAAVGRQITIGVGIPGLAPGVYTLLPAAHALLPGAYRVEVGRTNPLAPVASGLSDGTWLASGVLSTANTGVRSALPSQIVVTPGDSVRRHSQYNETSYADFLLADAKRFGNPRPGLPADGKTLQLVYQDPDASTPALKFGGTVRFDAAPGGYAGTLSVDSSSKIGTNLEVLAPGGTATPGFVSIDSSALNAIDAPRMMIGGGMRMVDGVRRTLAGYANSVSVRAGAELTAREVLLLAQAGGITIEDGARISTLGEGADTPYPSTDGYVYSTGSNLVAVSNGLLNVIQVPSAGTSKGISIGKSELYGEGSLLFSTRGNGQLTLDGGARYGAKYLTLSMPSINIGEQAALDAAANVLPNGLRLNQDLLSRLLAGNSGIGVPRLENLVLTASQSVNFYGTTALNTIDPVTGRSSLASFVLNTPAIYGLGNAGDVATITTDKLVWNGISDGVTRTTINQAPSSLKPGAVIAGGAGTGSGTLNIVARDMVFGYGPLTQPDTQLTLDRLTLGFANVNVQASGKITANNRNTLSVYQSQGAYQPGTGYQYSGGNLNLVTPLLTGESGSINRITAGGALSVSAGAGAGSASTDALGAETGLKGNTVSIASAIVLPSGKLTLSGDSGVTLADGARIAVAGRAIQMADVTKYSAGGDVLIDSAHGSVSQAAGAVIDVSAQNNHAGSVSVTALDAAAGRVDLAGTIRGAASGRYDAGGTDVPWQAGSVDVRAQTVNDFAGLNQRLNTGSVTGSRSFQLKQGDLVIGDELKANTINVSLDSGSLTVNGRVDASGEQPGTIRLAAHNGLTLGSGAVLDAHGARLRVDSYGLPIDAPNRGIVELRATDGRLMLSPGAVIDVRAADNVARGTVTLSAPRIGADAQGDMDIDASGPLDIRGAKSIAVQGFRRYSNAPLDTAPGVDGKPNQVITQGWMNGVDADSRNFINAAWANGNLQARVAGLSTYGAAYHLRPGVEIVSATPNGNLLVRGDLDFSGYRYGPNADPNVRGSGEPGALVLRAGGKLQVSGSINDGFAPPPATQDEMGWVLMSGKQPYGNDVVVSRSGVTLADGTLFAPGTVLNYDVPLRSFSLPANTIVPAALKLGGNVNLPAGTVLRAAVRNAAGNVVYPAGTMLRQDTTLTTGMTLDAGNVLAVPAMVASIVWPKGVALAGPGTTGIALNGALNLAVGAIVPGSTTVKLPNNAQFVALRDTVNGSEGANWAIAPMLQPGTESWAMRLVSGADTAAADGRAVRPDAQKDGNLVLGDAHFSAQMPTKTTVVARFPMFSVLRTGTGDLDLVSGGNIDMRSTYGVYTAGTQSTPLLDGSGDNPYNQPRGTELTSGSTVLGPNGAPYERFVDGGSATSLYQAWYPEQGGNVILSARGAITGHTLGRLGANDFRYLSYPGAWLWRQGGAGSGLPTAWWVNFGTYAYGTPDASNATLPSPILVGFTGIGTLGGGNVSVRAGADMGMQSNLGTPAQPVSEALNIAVASTGRLGPDGKLVLTGGGDLSLNVGGGVNPIETRLRNPSVIQDDSGILTDLRGNLRVDAGSIGRIDLAYGQATANDPRGINVFAPTAASPTDGLVIVPGDATVSLSTRGDLVLASVGDAGRLKQMNATPYIPTLDGVLAPQSGGGYSWFSLWTNKTALNLFSAGGNLTPTTQSIPQSNTADVGGATDSRFVYPGTLRAVAASGNVYYGGGLSANTSLVLAPSPLGQLEILANGSLYANGYAISQSGASQSVLATPFAPGFRGYGVGAGTVLLVDNTSMDSSAVSKGSGTPLFAFGADTVSGILHANDSEPARFYAVNGDIVGLRTGEVLDFTSGGQNPSWKTLTNWYVAAKPTWIVAGRDIVGAGTAPGTSTPTGFSNTTSTGNLLLNNNPNDISVVSAGRDILFGNFRVAGPGTLEVTAGRNLYQADKGLLESIGRIGTAISTNAGDRSSGAGISVMAGAGAAGGDFTTFARRYLDAANLANPNAPLADQTGKVVKTYEKELLDWLQTRFDYKGTQDGALAFYLGLPPEQQRVFARSVYFSELRAGGREYNDPTSRRFGSYLRGRQAIASLFPDKDAQGRPIQRDGTITMFGPSGIRTDFGGAIQTLTPGGKLIVGVEGLAPPATSGLLTQGAGDIQVYSKDSVLLGLSRIMTTFGGGILVWSAEGDINAGRGSKTSLLYTPPLRVYDGMGNITLSPQVPSSGAGIATLNPIPEVPRGDVDLIAPLGTVDPGEAGIRVSGDINVAALRVVNAANIQAQGESRGIPTVALVNVSALSSASAAANSATQAAQDVMRQQQAAARNGLPSIITVQVLGYGGAGGGENGDGAQKAPPPERQDRSSYDPGSAFQMIGNGDLSERQKMRLTAAERKNL